MPYFPTRYLFLAVLFGFFHLPLVHAQKPSKTLRQFVQDDQGLRAYGLYFQNKKAGWITEQQTLEKQAGKEYAVYRTEGMIQMTVLGAAHTMKFHETVRYSLEGEGPIVFIKERSTDDGMETIHTAQTEGDRLVIATVQGNRKTTRTTELPKDTLRQGLRLENWIQSHPKKGDTFEAYGVSISEADINQPEKYTFLQRKKITWRGVPVEVSHVQLTQKGLTFSIEITDDGRLLNGKMGPLDVRVEELATAKNLDVVVMDGLTNIPVKKDLGDPSDVDVLHLEVRGLGDFKFPTSHRQKLRPGKNGAMILELTRDHRKKEAQPLTPQQRKKYLRATPQIQSDAKEIRALAEKIIGGEKDPVRSADLLQQWIFEQLRQTYRANATTALQVLDQKAGDCTEHTLLFTALARAAGIPAREVGGVAFGNYGQPIFGWHAWAQIHDGSQWVTVDPTWNEVYVDATHIQLQNEEDNMSWVNLLGNLKFKIIKVEKRK